MHPLLFRMPYADAPVYAYGFMLGLALVVGWNLSVYLAWRDGLPMRRAAWAPAAVAVLALIGSRLLHLVVNPAEWTRPGSWLDLRGGLVAYGGFIGGTLGAYLSFAGSGAGFLRYADVLSPVVALGTALTRVGCFLNGCDFGTPTALPFGVRFPRDRVIGAAESAGASPAWLQHFETGTSLGGETVDAGSAWSLPVHPTQLYEVLLGLVLFALLVHLRRRKRFAGQVFLTLTAGYGVGRALIESFRDDAQRGVVAGLATSQFLGLTTALLALAAILVLRPRRGEDALV